MKVKTIGLLTTSSTGNEIQSILHRKDIFKKCRKESKCWEEGWLFSIFILINPLIKVIVGCGEGGGGVGEEEEVIKFYSARTCFRQSPIGHQ